MCIIISVIHYNHHRLQISVTILYLPYIFTIVSVIIVIVSVIMSVLIVARPEEAVLQHRREPHVRPPADLSRLIIIITVKRAKEGMLIIIITHCYHYTLYVTCYKIQICY